MGQLVTSSRYLIRGEGFLNVDSEEGKEQHEGKANTAHRNIFFRCS